MRDLLALSLDIDILTKAADSASYHAILRELKDKEIYNMIVDIRSDAMSDFLKAVSDKVYVVNGHGGRIRSDDDVGGGN